MKTHTVYHLVFSTRRLIRILERAGFEVTPPPDCEPLARFTSEPTEDKITLEFAHPYGEWAERTEKKKPNGNRQSRPVSLEMWLEPLDTRA